jgi:hypothetical protein
MSASPASSSPARIRKHASGVVAVVVLLSFGLFALGCVLGPERKWEPLASDFSEEYDYAALKAFISVAVDRRLESAIASGDHRYLGVYGYTLAVPGVPESSVPTPDQVLVIPGTSDDGDPGLNQRARDYAMSYNRQLVAHFSDDTP